MHNNDEMMTQLFMEEEANATAERQQQRLMLANLLRLLQHLLIASASPWRFEDWESTE
jgi:hypothetical protein